MCVNMLLHADGVNYREVEQQASLQQHYREGGTKEDVIFTPQHLDIEKIQREIKLVIMFL